MAKMYYSEEETCQKLGKSLDELMELVNNGELQMYQDGAKHVYKASDVDSLSGGEVTLAPDEDAIDLSAESAPAPSGNKKEDTVITAEGISIFDDEDLEIDEADPMAKTQIAPSLDDQVALEGIGSGSGLLDLTRESDDTSLGPVLDNLEVEGGSGLGSGLVGEAGTGMDNLSVDTGYATSAPEPPTFVEAVDSSSGFFSGMLLGSTLVTLLAVFVAGSSVGGSIGSFVEGLRKNTAIALGAMVVVILIAGVIGLVIGKGVAQKQAAYRRLG